MERVNILCTKQLEPLLAGKAAVQGIRVVIKPFIRINHLHKPAILQVLQQVPDGINWVFTSHNAVEAVYQLKRKHGIAVPLPGNAYCMEGRTADNFRLLFPGISIAGKAADSASLAALIIQHQVPAIVFCCGNLRRQELPEMLVKQKITIHEIQVYETVSTPVQLKEKFDGLMFFSPSGVQSFCEKNTIEPKTVCFAIGETTASAIRKVSSGTVITASQPNQESMVNTVIAYYRKK
jgi:uroporphyrinogen-III synthase